MNEPLPVILRFNSLIRARLGALRTIRRGREDLAAWLPDAPPLRHGGRARVGPAPKKDPGLILALLELVAPHTAGDPMTPQKWFNARLRDIQDRLATAGHTVSLPVISRLLRAADYCLRVNHKQLAGTQHPKRDQQFAHIRAEQQEHLDAGQPVISVDTKKQERVGDFKNAGQV